MSSDSTDCKKPSHSKKRFTAEEDKKLQDLINVHGKKWDVIAEHMEGRNSRQCRERYNNYLAPSVSHEKWTPEEDEYLRKFVKSQPSGPIQWATVRLKGRTPNACKNRWNVHLRKTPNSVQTNRQSETYSDSDSVSFSDEIFDEYDFECFL